MKNKKKKNRVIDPLYSSGKFHEESSKNNNDAKFKSECFTKLLFRILDKYKLKINSYTDVGCGNGQVIKLVRDSYNLKYKKKLDKICGFDIHPFIKEIRDDEITFVQNDFLESKEYFDLVTLFDVIEHVVSPIDFLKSVSEKSCFIGLHIPLDNNFNIMFRNLFRKKIIHPGHLTCMDSAFALNLITLSGLRIIDYEYTFSFLAPSGYSSFYAKILFPIRYLFAKISPWLMSKTIGGVSIMVLAVTDKGLRDHKFII